MSPVSRMPYCEARQEVRTVGGSKGAGLEGARHKLQVLRPATSTGCKHHTLPHCTVNFDHDGTSVVLVANIAAEDCMYIIIISEY